MQPTLELEWLIHYKCNFRCPYCFFEGMWEEVEARNVYRPLEEWLAMWDRIRQKYGFVRLLITGGEPFIYPDFVKLVATLAPRFSIGFDTNLGCPKELVEEFADTVPQSEFLSIAMSFHPRFARYEDFLDKALLLKKKNFQVYVQYVSYPPQIGLMADYKSRFQEEGLNLIPLPFRGVYEGNVYPDAYTQEERSIVYQAQENLVPAHKEKVDKLLNQVSSKQRLCRAGEMYARIDSDGTVYRCGASVSNVATNPMGSIFDHDFKFFIGPVPCLQEKCPCESRWLV